MTKKEIAILAVDALKKEFPDAICSLTYKDPLQLLVATRLAAQCTDARVNMVTPALFEKYKCAEDFANANVEDVEELKMFKIVIAQKNLVLYRDLKNNKTLFTNVVFK